ncbi:MAG: hypothetical protein IJM84_01010 [Bacteroidaceae bacterium]|nr:hypothetical protein [Bacteroidaceae bacterium]
MASGAALSATLGATLGVGIGAGMWLAKWLILRLGVRGVTKSHLFPWEGHQAFCLTHRAKHGA